MSPSIGNTCGASRNRNVAIGSKTVFINGMPAARMGDMIMEAVSPAPNSIIMGYDTVIIG